MHGLKRTPIYPLYAKYGAKTIDFGGWDLPVQFVGIQKEHEAVRTKAGVFDVSHMGEFLVSGADSLAFLQRMLTNDIGLLSTDQAMYTLMCYPDGGIVDDLLVYKLEHERYMLVVNAANIDKDWEWLHKHIENDDLLLEDISDQTGLIAIQGPDTARLLGSLSDAPLEALGSFRFEQDVQFGDITARIVSRTGYTGEDGFEIYVDAQYAPDMWELLLAAGQSEQLIPAGLGARDTLRFEARLPLYGQELSASITPLEAGLGMFVKLDKPAFIGREALVEQKARGLQRKLVGIEMIDRGIPRAHYDVFSPEGDSIGCVTTGTQSPTLKTNVGLAIVNVEYAELGAELLVDIRGKRLRAKVVKTPFYKKTMNR